MGIDSIKSNKEVIHKGNKTSTTSTVIGSVGAAASIYGIDRLWAKKLAPKTGCPLSKSLDYIYMYETDNGNSIMNSINKMYEESGLPEKGVEIFDYKYGISTDAAVDLFGGQKKKTPQRKLWTLEEIEEFARKHPRKYKRQVKKEMKQLEKAFSNIEKYGTNDKDIIMMEKHPKLYKMITKLKLRTFKGIFAVMDSALWGINAFAHGKKVHINSESYMNVMLPHELGHVKNNISFGFGKFLQVTRHALAMNPMCYLPLFILGVAAFRDKKNDGEKSESTIGKGLDFVKDNCVGLAAATQIPTLAEEGLASAKGLKMVKNYVKPNEFKMLRGAMGKAWWTYFCGAALFTGTVFVANSIKNIISAPKATY